MPNYAGFIEQRFKIIDKTNHSIPFTLNTIQNQYLTIDAGRRDVILKARQQGFSSVILAKFAADFIMKPNSQSVVVADSDENAKILLKRVKDYLNSYAEITGAAIPLKYNSKTELVNDMNGAMYTIGTAKNQNFGRSRTITNLHLSEAAFYPYLESILAGALQAVTEDGYAVLETTANGFNYFKSFWDECMSGQSTFKPLFYKASDFYSADFLEAKRRELKGKFSQEYPETPEEAFLTSGDPYFDTEALQIYSRGKQLPIRTSPSYV